MKRTCIGLIAAGVSLFAAGCGAQRDTADEERVTVGRVDLRDVLTQTGEVRPVVKVDLKSEASGRIDTVYVREGQRVRRGDTIIVIDPSRLLFKKERIELAVQKSRIEADVAQRDLENARELVHTGTVSERSIVDFESRSNLATIAYRQQMLDLKDVNDELSKTVVVSPMDGVITVLEADAGEIAVSATGSFSGGSAIATIADISRLEVISQIGAADYSNVRIGQKVLIRPETVGDVFTTGAISFIALSAKKVQEDELGTFEVRIAIDSLISGITAGINVNVDFVMLEKKNVCGVPNLAVRRQGGKYTVMKLVKDGGQEHVRRTPVTLGATDFRNYEVLSGLAEGDVVVMNLEKEQKRPGNGGGGGRR